MVARHGGTNLAEALGEGEAGGAGADDQDGQGGGSLCVHGESAKVQDTGQGRPLSTSCPALVRRQGG